MALKFNETNTNLKIYENLSADDYAELTKEEHAFYIVKDVGIYKGTVLISGTDSIDRINVIEQNLIQLNNDITLKQDKLTAGENITINNNVISTPDVPPILNAVPEAPTPTTPKFFMVGGQLYIKAFAGYLTFSSDDAFELTVRKETSNDGSLEYSTDTVRWTEVTKGTAISSVNNKIYLRGSGNTYVQYGPGDQSVFYFSGSNIKCEGNIETLLDYQTVLNGGHPEMAEHCFAFMFFECANLITAPELPATTLADSCYEYMFRGCTSLTQAPVLPATTLTYRCYSCMFWGCTSLTTAPTLSATTLAAQCYEYMFHMCTSLIEAPKLPATTLAEGCYSCMFYYCTALTTAPELPATTLARGCYAHMFTVCTNLTQAPALPVTTLAEGCYYGMFWGCTNLTTVPALPATTLAEECYSCMFEDCTNIKLSTTQSDEYPNAYRIPSGTATGTTATDALTDMFKSTGGTFTDTPEINITYYTSNEII